MIQKIIIVGYNACDNMSSTTDQYANADVLVDTNWVLQHHKDGNVKIVEVDYDPAANYNTGNIP